jgi:hypothetical protein
VEAALVRYVDDDGGVELVLIGCTTVPRSLPALSLKGVLQSQKLRAQLRPELTVFESGDSVATNLLYVKLVNEELALVQSPERLLQSCVYVACGSHMFNNTGKKLKEPLVNMLQFLQGAKGVLLLDSCKDLYKDLCGTRMPDGSDNRWGSWHDKESGCWDNWSNIATFVNRSKVAGWMPAFILQMESVLDTPSKKLQLGLEFEFLLAVMLGRPLYAATYNMERHGLVAAFTFCYFTTVDQHMTALEQAGANSATYQLLETWAQQHRYGQITPSVVSQTVREVWAFRLPHIVYWKDKIRKGMKRWIELF